MRVNSSATPTSPHTWHADDAESPSADAGSCFLFLLPFDFFFASAPFTPCLPTANGDDDGRDLDPGEGNLRLYTFFSSLAAKSSFPVAEPLRDLFVPAPPGRAADPRVPLAARAPRAPRTSPPLPPERGTDAAPVRGGDRCDNRREVSAPCRCK